MWFSHPRDGAQIYFSPGPNTQRVTNDTLLSVVSSPDDLVMWGQQGQQVELQNRHKEDLGTKAVSAFTDRETWGWADSLNASLLTYRMSSMTAVLTTP